MNNLYAYYDDYTWGVNGYGNKVLIKDEKAICSVLLGKSIYDVIDIIWA